MWRKSLKYGGYIIALLLVVIQFIQPARTNPPADPAASFDTIAKPSPQVAAIVHRARQQAVRYRDVARSFL